MVILAEGGGQANDEAERYAAHGQQALAAGQYDVARGDFEKLVKLEPEVAEVHANLAVVYFKLYQYQLAVREIRTAQRLKPGLKKLDSLLGFSLAELGRFPDALPLLEKGFKQTADQEVRRMCGLELLRSYTGLGRDDDAVEIAVALNKSYPDDPEILYHTGRIYGNLAYIVIEKLNDKAPGSIWMLQAQGEAEESQKAYDLAIATFNGAIELDPRHPGIHYRLGRVYLSRFREGHQQNAEDRDAAMKEFRAELNVNPSNGNAGYEIAEILHNLGNLDEARKQFEEVLERFPDFEEAIVGLAAVLQDSNKTEQAVSLLERATRLRPDDEVAWYRLAHAERLAGNVEAQKKALAVYKKLHSSALGSLRIPNGDKEITPQIIDGGTNP
jgi:tetratricopeptide (TPR) repeat protein